jgi:hypothetical protein
MNVWTKACEPMRWYLNNFELNKIPPLDIPYILKAPVKLKTVNIDISCFFWSKNSYIHIEFHIFKDLSYLIPNLSSYWFDGIRQENIESDKLIDLSNVKKIQKSESKKPRGLLSIIHLWSSTSLTTIPVDNNPWTWIST